MAQIKKFKSIVEAGENEVEPYDAAKRRLLEEYGETEEKKLRRLLNSHQIQTENVKPSQTPEPNSIPTLTCASMPISGNTIM